jgi:hypothetical protein
VAAAAEQAERSYEDLVAHWQPRHGKVDLLCFVLANDGATLVIESDRLHGTLTAGDRITCFVAEYFSRYSRWPPFGYPTISAADRQPLSAAG